MIRVSLDRFRFRVLEEGQGASLRMSNWRTGIVRGAASLSISTSGVESSVSLSCTCPTDGCSGGDGAKSDLLRGERSMEDGRHSIAFGVVTVKVGRSALTS